MILYLYKIWELEMNISKVTENEEQNLVSPSSDISIKDLSKNVLESLLAESWECRRGVIYLVQIVDETNRYVLSCYPNTTLEELPIKIIRDESISDDGVFIDLLRYHWDQGNLKDTILSKHVEDNIINTGLLIGKIDPKVIEYLYCQILKDPKQILSDLKIFDEENFTNYFYCFEDEFCFQQLKKELSKNYPSSWKKSSDGMYTWIPRNNEGNQKHLFEFSLEEKQLLGII